MTSHQRPVRLGKGTSDSHQTHTKSQSAPRTLRTKPPFYWLQIPRAAPFFLNMNETESQYTRPTHWMTPLPLNPLLPLCQLPAGSMGRVRELTGDFDFCQRVREMGFGE